MSRWWLPRLFVLVTLLGAGWLAPMRPLWAASPTLRLNLDAPVESATALGELVISGWAADPAAAHGTGVEAVHVYLDKLPWEGGALLGGAEYGLPRPDVAALLGDARFEPVGFRFKWQVAATPGPHPLFVVAQDADGAWTPLQRLIIVDPHAPRYPELQPPGENDNPANHFDAGTELLSMRDAMTDLSSMREHRTGRILTEDGRETNLNLYNLEYEAPDRRSQRSTVTTTVDSAEQRIITIGETSWFWRGGDKWEETRNREAFAFPADINRFHSVYGATMLADDEIDGHTYRVLEFLHVGSEWIGAPGWVYRTRLWLDAETHLPLKAQKAATQTQVMADMKVVIVTYREDTQYFDFNAPITIEPPG